MGMNRTEQTLSSRKATNSRVAPLRGATLGGCLLLTLSLQAATNNVCKDLEGHSVGSDLDPNCLTNCLYPCKKFLNKLI